MTSNLIAVLCDQTVVRCALIEMRRRKICLKRSVFEHQCRKKSVHGELNAVPRDLNSVQRHLHGEPRRPFVMQCQLIVVTRLLFPQPWHLHGVKRHLTDVCLHLFAVARHLADDPSPLNEVK